MLDTKVSKYDKVRIIALYIMVIDGITEEHFTKLATHANISQEERDMILNIAYLGVNVICDVSVSIVLN